MKLFYFDARPSASPAASYMVMETITVHFSAVLDQHKPISTVRMTKYILEIRFGLMLSAFLRTWWRKLFGKNQDSSLLYM